MPFETTCNDVETRRVHLNPNGDLDSVPTYTHLSGAGTFEPAEDGLSVRMISEDNVVGNGPFDTVVEVKAMAGGMELADTITLHVSNDVQTQPATSFGMSADAPEPK